MAKKSKVMFKSMLAFRLPSDWNISAAKLNEQLCTHQFSPCGSQQEVSRGFTFPRTETSNELVHAVGSNYLFMLQEQKRMLPASVVKDALAEKAAEVAARQGYAPGRKQLKELKEQVRLELLPKAFVKNSVTRAWLNPKTGWLVMEASGSRADTLLEAMSRALDVFPARRLVTNMSPEAAMSLWLTTGEAPDGFTVDRDCELKSPVEDKAAVRYVRHSLDGQDVRDHLAQGKRATRLALTYDDRVSFLLTNALELKSLALLDIAADEEPEDDNADDIFNAEFLLMAEEYTKLLVEVTAALGGEAESA